MGPNTIGAPVFWSLAVTAGALKLNVAAAAVAL